MEIVSLSPRRSIRGSILDYRIPSEYFNDSYSVACWPLRDSGMDVIGGNHILLTNAKFSEGACYFNGSNAFGITRNPVNLSTTNKVSLFFEWYPKVYDLTNQTIIIEHGPIAGTTAGTFNATTLGNSANDPLRFVARGDVNANNADFYPNNNNVINLFNQYAVIYNFSNPALSEVSLIFNGSIKTPDAYGALGNNTGNFTSQYLNISARNNGNSLFHNGSLKNILIRSTVDSPETIADYTAWMGDKRRSNFWSLYFPDEVEIVPRVDRGRIDKPLKKVKIHPSPDIPVRVEKRISELNAQSKKSTADHVAIIRELDEISASIQRAIEISSAAVSDYLSPGTIILPNDASPEKLIGPKSMTARMATEKLQTEAFARARRLAAETERIAEVARQEEYRMVHSAMSTIINMLD